MNKVKWLAAEAKKWKDEGIIDEDQHERIMSRYAGGARTPVLPILAAVLLGLGVLTFIASNWQGLLPGTKLTTIIVSLAAAYAAGEWGRRKGHEGWGVALTIVGIAIYGAGIFLIGQIYQVSAHPVYAFYLWFAGAVPLAWHYRSRLIAWVCLLILTVSALYGMEDRYHDGMERVFFYLLFAAGLAPLVWRFRGAWLTALSGSLLLVSAAYDLDDVGDGMVYPVLFLACYLAGQWLPTSLAPIPTVLRNLGYLGSVLLTVFLIFEPYDIPAHNVTDTWLAAGLALLAGWSAMLSYRARQPENATDLIPFLAHLLVYWLSPLLLKNAAVVLILGLFAFAIGMIVGGERKRQVDRINLGALFFGVSCVVGYVNFAWDFLDKSLFFLLGGALMLVISGLLERQRRKWVNDARRESR
ncbi:DUF2157 domain-containing protein [Brevibacillus sp. SYP-B805]|uniref:DUF2157 domain-containing protein n=1 Tax=Brevibacillus sp. SYP-B805 TaxID=1578199 RepID=UPI0013EBF2A3|nr:DUF2157 domain-containing protein [Brevibacillus sp. SYP-B805]NGQ97471.1 DUF2157 domain-containing protein [Brevibacillus sp. SYP-B805]